MLKHIALQLQFGESMNKKILKLIEQRLKKGEKSYKTAKKNNTLNLSHDNQFIAHNFEDPLGGGDSYVNYSNDSRSDAYS